MWHAYCMVYRHWDKDNIIITISNECYHPDYISVVFSICKSRKLETAKARKAAGENCLLTIELYVINTWAIPHTNIDLNIKFLHAITVRLLVIFVIMIKSTTESILKWITVYVALVRWWKFISDEANGNRAAVNTNKWYRSCCSTSYYASIIKSLG